MKRISYVKLRAGLFGLLFLSAACHTVKEGPRYEVVKAEGEVIKMDSKWDVHPDEAATALLDTYKKKVDATMYEVIGKSGQRMEKGTPESLLSNLVAEVLRRSAAEVLDKPADIGLVNLGGLRNILPQGDITVGTIYEILPFENSLCVLTIRGGHLKRMCRSIARARGEGVSGLRLEITQGGELLKAEVAGAPIDDDRLYTVATVDYLADGNDHMEALLQAEKRVCPANMTLRGLFLDYVRQQTAAGKTISSRLDGRITVK